MMVLRVIAAQQRGWRGFFTFASVLCAVLFADLQNGATAQLAADEAAETQGPAVAERYVLPITPPLDQGDSDLCWVYSTLSMLETNYKVRHPRSRITLSRGAVQRVAIADRFRRRIRGQPVRLEEGGVAVEALALIRKHGLVARDDFHHAAASDPLYSSIARKLAGTPDPALKQRVLEQELEKRLGAKPPTTHLDGQAVSPEQLAEDVLGHERWIEFDRSRDGVQGWGPSRDPDARPETRVIYVKLDRMTALIHRSLAKGKAVVAGTADHAFVIYGADYDKNGKPLSYLIKDSLPPFTRRAGAEEFAANLNDVTVAPD